MTKTSETLRTLEYIQKGIENDKKIYKDKPEILAYIKTIELTLKIEVYAELKCLEQN